MTANAASFDKAETVAYRLYLADFQLNQEHGTTPKEWFELDADDKFNWMYLAEASIREMSAIPDDILRTVVEAYRNRSPFPIEKGDTWESVMAGFFQHGWDAVFEQFGQPVFPENGS